MRNILCLFSLFLTTTLFSQVDTTINLDLLRAPVSPASNLLGISPSDIDKPSDVSAFMLNLQSATSSFTSIPKNYSVDIAPYWLFVKPGKRQDYTTEGFKKSFGKGVFKQTFVISAAIRNPDTSETSFNSKSNYSALGFKFSIVRGEYDQKTIETLDAIQVLQSIKLRHLDAVLTGYMANNDEAVIALRQDLRELIREGLNSGKTLDAIRGSEEFLKVQSELNKKLSDFKELEKREVQDELDQKIQKLAADFQTARIGWTWDIAAGISAEFLNRRFDSSKVYNAGIWTTFGYTSSSFGSLLGIVRYLHNPDQIFAKNNTVNDVADISTLDAGIRYIFSKPQSRFNLSMEAIYRSVLSKNTIDPSWRLVLNADYSIWKNQKLTFSFGRNFDGVISNGGNLIAGLSFLTGFGNKR